MKNLHSITVVELHEMHLYIRTHSMYTYTVCSQKMRRFYVVYARSFVVSKTSNKTNENITCLYNVDINTLFADMHDLCMFIKYLPNKKRQENLTNSHLWCIKNFPNKKKCVENRLS